MRVVRLRLRTSMMNTFRSTPSGCFKRIHAVPAPIGALEEKAAIAHGGGGNDPLESRRSPAPSDG